MSDSRWHWTGLVLAAGLVVPGLLLAARAENRPGFAIRLGLGGPVGVEHDARLSRLGPVERPDRRARLLPGSRRRRLRRRLGPGTSRLDGRRRDVESGRRRPDLHVCRPRPDHRPDAAERVPARSTSGDAPRRPPLRRPHHPGDRPRAGSKVVSSGEVRPPGAVPEPASLLSSSLGVIILGMVYAHRHRRKLRVGLTAVGSRSRRIVTRRPSTLRRPSA